MRDKVIELLFSGEKTQREITSLLRASRSRVSELLNQLEKRGFVSRKRVGGRTVVVSLNTERTLRVGILKSSEYFHVLAAARSLEKEFLVRIKVYDNSLEALKSLLVGEEDLVTSPLVSGFFFHMIDSNVKPIAAVAKGGSGIISRRESGLIGTTPLSSMDRESMRVKSYTRTYFKSVEEILKAYRDGQIDAASIWEPFLSMNGGSLYRSDSVCCCVFTTKTTKAVTTFKKKYLMSIEKGTDCRKRKEICNSLASILGVEFADVERSLSSYEFTSTVDRNDATRQISEFGFSVEKGVDQFLEKCPKVPV
ncbi:MAG: helix-turn-helix domain-containing protein [Thermoplasmatales archaeon]